MIWKVIILLTPFTLSLPSHCISSDLEYEVQVLISATTIVCDDAYHMIRLDIQTLSALQLTAELLV